MPTVLVTGVEGFQTLADGYADDTPVTFFGGGGLVVSNSAANFGLYSDFSTLNLAGLGNLVVDVDRISLNNFSLYPNRYTNGLYSPSGSHGFSNAGQDVYLAQSNHLKTAWIGGDAVIVTEGAIEA